MSWLKTILLALQFLSWLVKELERQKVFNAGESSQLKKYLEQAHAELQEVIAVRIRARKYLDDNPDRVREPDDFQRKD